MSLVAAMLLLAGIGQAGTETPPPVLHEQRLDDVGPVSVAGTSSTLSMTHRGLPAGSFAEVTDLDSGRTIIVLVEAGAGASDPAGGRLSPAAGRALGLGAATVANVRVRPAVPSPAEQAAVRAGTVVGRLDAPTALLTALRRRLPQPAPAPVIATVPVATRTVSTPSASGQRSSPPPVQRPATTTAPSKPVPAKPVPVVTGRWFVQVATLSDAGRARTLAKSVDGVVRSAGRLYRVQAGPFATRAAAETARASIARRGFGDARIIAQD